MNEKENMADIDSRVFYIKFILSLIIHALFMQEMGLWYICQTCLKK